MVNGRSLAVFTAIRPAASHPQSLSFSSLELPVLENVDVRTLLKVEMSNVVLDASGSDLGLADDRGPESR
jgi:hypothetical protein